MYTRHTAIFCDPAVILFKNSHCTPDHWSMSMPYAPFIRVMDLAELS